MRCSLFGKLAQKRDFIALFAPREFLNAWEPWMQSAVSASRQSLGDGWQQAYLTAPIWRFWLGAEICGTPILGAFMSSVDGMGRYYPLTLFAHADPGSAIPPPDLDAQDPWLLAAEDFLLSTLDNAIAFETITGGLDQLASPTQQSTGTLSDDISVLHDGTAGKAPGEEPFADAFTSLRTRQPRRDLQRIEFLVDCRRRRLCAICALLQADARPIPFHRHADWTLQPRNRVE